MPKSPKLRVGDSLELKVEKLSFGDGDGVARANGVVIFVPLSAPGDLIRAEVISVKKNFAKARIQKILEAGPARREAPCPVFGDCGGCQWQHLHYQNQLVIKDELLKESFHRAGLSVENWLSIAPSPDEFHYRNRIQVQFKDGSFGFRKRKSHQFVMTSSCHLAEPELVDRATSEAKQLQGRYEIYRSEDGDIRCRDTESATLGDFFSQVNDKQNHLLKSWVNEVTPSKITTIWDLYGGGGNFSLMLAKKLPGARVFCVDSNDVNIEAGKSKAQAMRLTNIEFFSGTTHAFLSTAPPSDFCIVDPPRAGIDTGTLELLTQSHLKSLVYISCDPMTLVRDLRSLSADGWSIEQVRPLDMFPQTYHLETFCLLTRSS